MTCFDEYFEKDFDLENLLTKYKPYQREIVMSLLSYDNIDDGLEAYFSSAGPMNMACFGGDSGDKKSYKERFIIETRKLICGDSGYQAEQQKMSLALTGGVEAFVSYIAASISKTLDISEVYLIPCVIFVIVTIAKVGIKAYCAGITSEN